MQMIKMLKTEIKEFEQPSIGSMLRYFQLPMMTAFCTECGECLKTDRVSCSSCMRLYHPSCLDQSTRHSEHPTCTTCRFHSICALCELVFYPEEPRTTCSICHCITHICCRDLPDLTHPDNHQFTHFSLANIVCIRCFDEYPILKSIASVVPTPNNLFSPFDTSETEKYWLVELAHTTPGHYTWVTHKQWLSAKKKTTAVERLQPSIKHIISVFIPAVHSQLKVSDLLERETAVWDDLMWMVDWGESEAFSWEKNWRLQRFKGDGRAFLHRLRLSWIECSFFLKREKAMKTNSVRSIIKERLANRQQKVALMRHYFNLYKERMVAGKEETGNVLLFKLQAGVRMKARMVLKSTKAHLQKEAPEIIAHLVRKVYSELEVPSGVVLMLDDSECEKWLEILKRSLPGLCFLVLQDGPLLRKLIYYQLRSPINNQRRFPACDVLLIPNGSLEAVCHIVCLEDLINNSSLFVLSPISSALARRYIHMANIAVIKIKIVPAKNGGVLPLQMEEVSTFSSGSMESSLVLPKLQNGEEDAIDAQLWREKVKQFTNNSSAFIASIADKRDRAIVLREMLSFGMGTRGESLVDAAMEEEKITYNKPDRNNLRKSIIEYVAILTIGLKQLTKKKALSAEEKALLGHLTSDIEPLGIIKRVTNLYRLRKFYPTFAQQPDKLNLQPSEVKEWRPELDMVLARQVLQWGYGRWGEIALTRFDFQGNGKPLTLEAYCNSIGIAQDLQEHFFQDRLEAFFTFLAVYAPQTE